VYFALDAASVPNAICAASSSSSTMTNRAVFFDSG